MSKNVHQFFDKETQLKSEIGTGIVFRLIRQRLLPDEDHCSSAFSFS